MITPYFISSRKDLAPIGAGISLKDGIVQREGTAPKLKFMIGWTETRVLKYCSTHGWKMEKC